MWELRLKTMVIVNVFIPTRGLEIHFAWSAYSFVNHDNFIQPLPTSYNSYLLW